MEQFGARKSTAIQTCLEEVRKTDIFVCIIAFMYGSIEKGTKKSFTQLEYEKAVEEDKEILIYIMEDNALVKANHVERGESAELLESFKSLLKKNHTIDFFTNPEQLAKRIIKRIIEIRPHLDITKVKPNIIECSLTRFTFRNNRWIALVGYILGKPIELFTIIEDLEMFPIPSSIDKGFIMKTTDENENIRYDFQYIDKYGYKNTLGGISHSFDNQAFGYSAIISQLLLKDLSNSELLEVISYMNTFGKTTSYDGLM
jgi:hypothetical protein